MAGRCCVCTSRDVSEKNLILRCSQCSITVHQACYGVSIVPTHRWFCKKCEPHSLVRASKVKCMFCPAKDGALKPITGAKSGSPPEVWAHILCALWIPKLGFDHDKERTHIDVSKHEAGAPDTCMLLVVLAGVEEGRRDVSHTGTCISCSSEGCSHKFHVTCAYKRGLLHGRSARCSSCMMKKAAGGAVTKAPSASETPSTSLRQSRRTSQRDTRVFETSGGKKATHNCPEPGCGREYHSQQGLKYHLLHHHPEKNGGSDAGPASRKRAASATDDERVSVKAKVRALESQKHDGSGATGLKCYADAVKAVCGNSEFPSLSAEKTRLASAVRDTVADRMHEVYGDVGLLRRLEETQMTTSVLVENVGQLAQTRDELLAEIATLEDTLPTELNSVKANRSESARHNVASNVRGSLLHVLSYVAGGVAIHPTELPALMKSITAALGPRVAKGDGVVEPVLPPIDALRKAILSVVSPDAVL